MSRSSLFKVFIVLLVLVPIFTSFHGQPAEAASWKSKVSADILNVRSKAGTKYSIVGKVKKNQVVTVTAQTKSWSKITSGKITGWVSSKYLTYVNWTGYVNATSLNVRKQATTRSAIVTKIPKATAVIVKGQNGSWLAVSIKSSGKTGWVSSSFISKNKVSTPSNTSTNLGTYSVTATSLYIRQSGSASAKVLFSLKKNTTVQLLKKKGNWGRIKTSDGRTGWGSLTYLKESDDRSSDTSLGTYYVTATSLNIRQSGSASAKVLFSLKKDTEVQLLEKKGNWGRIKTSDGRTGWGSLTYLKESDDHSSDTSLGTYYVTATSLNIRQSGSASAKVLFSLKKDTAVQLLEKNDNWGRIKTSDGRTGWGSLTYLSKTAISDNSNDNSNDNDNPSSSLDGKIIALDAGHGGYDPGAVGKSIYEKTLNLTSVMTVLPLLENAGAKVILTRSTDIFISLAQRVDISNKNNVDVFVSVHYNSGPISASGIETLYYPNRSKDKALAEALQGNLIQSTQMKNRGAKGVDLYVLRENNKPAALLELGFVTNPSEEILISSSSYQSKAANGILNGLEDYFDNN